MFLSRRNIKRRGDGGGCSQGGPGRVEPLNAGLFTPFNPINDICVLVPTQLDNDIAVAPVVPAVLEQVVELSILLTGEIDSDNLDDPSSLQFQALSRQLAEKVHLSPSHRSVCCSVCSLSLSLCHTLSHTHVSFHPHCTDLIHFHYSILFRRWRVDATEDTPLLEAGYDIKQF